MHQDLPAVRETAHPPDERVPVRTRRRMVVFGASLAFLSFLDRAAITRLSQLEGHFDYFGRKTGVKLSVCNGGMCETVAVKTYPL